ncbi:MAG: acyltransferase [bacterium]|nr:acyltransferase [bacterium]
MASLIYLWRNRSKSPLNSIAFFKNWAKRILSFSELSKRNQRRRRLISKGATIHESAEIGEVNIEGGYSYLQIGSETFLGRVKLSLHDEVKIGNRVCINDGVEILTASHDVLDPKWKEIKSKIKIEDYAWIGTGAMLLPGVTIGRGAVVAARAVVTKSVGPNEIVAGNPAKPINKKRCENLDYNPCEFLAANNAWLS